MTIIFLFRRSISSHCTTAANASGARRPSLLSFRANAEALGLLERDFCFRRAYMRCVAARSLITASNDLLARHARRL